LRILESRVFYMKRQRRDQRGTALRNSMSAFTQAKLASTVAELDKLPPPCGREVAFVGRSNAGKSSAINALTQRRKLAFVARRPGKTRLIHIFEVARARYLVDLPGYGYAAVSAAVREHWGALVEGYLATRESLVGLTLIMDVRHPLTSLDEQMIRWLGSRRLPVHILLTKADKLSYSQRIASLRDTRLRLRNMGASDVSVQLFSSRDRSGVEETQRVIAGWLDLELRGSAATAQDIALRK
jgi:GTP-binding protein